MHGSWIVRGCAVFLHVMFFGFAEALTHDVAHGGTARLLAAWAFAICKDGYNLKDMTSCAMLWNLEEAAPVYCT